MQVRPLGEVLVVGTGLIGTSIGLALRTVGHRVLLHDVDPDRVEVAAGRGAGQAWDGHETVDLAVVAAPPRATAPLLIDLARMDVARTLTHVASVQSQVQREVELLSTQMPDLRRCIVGSHPLAGREISGPEGGRADLFAGRPWALCAGETTSEQAVADVQALIEACGGQVVVLSADAHDEAVALHSHLPQVVASALAAQLVAAPEGRRLSGPGLADTTRIAASDPELWTQVLSANARHVAPWARRVAADLASLADALEPPGPQRASGAAPPDLDVVRDLLERGNAGRATVPLKRGRRDEAFATLAVDVPDAPGQLAGLLNAAAQAQVNVEDVRVEHVPGRPRGVIELLVHVAEAGRLAGLLGEQGWDVVAHIPPDR